MVLKVSKRPQDGSSPTEFIENLLFFESARPFALLCPPVSGVYPLGQPLPFLARLSGRQDSGRSAVPGRSVDVSQVEDDGDLQGLA